MTCDVEQIIEDSACVFCMIPQGMQPYALLAILCAIRDGNTDMACDPQSIVDEAVCLQCKIPDGYAFSALIAVACGIAQGGGGGGCQNLNGAGSPVGSVTPDCENQFYTDDSTDSLWQARGTDSSSWFQWV